MDDKNFEKAELIVQLLKSIPKEDYETTRVVLVENKINSLGDKFTTYENNFVSKFSEQYALGIVGGTVPELGGLQRQLQIPKHYIYSDEKDPDVELGYSRLETKYGHEVGTGFEFTTIPDFFIHKNEKDKQEENQEMILEFKTEMDLPEKRFAWDLFKLNLYLEKYSFQFAGFICLNNPKDRIERFLLQYLANKIYLTRKPERLFVFIRESFDAEIEYESLDVFAYNNGIKIG